MGGRDETHEQRAAALRESELARWVDQNGITHENLEERFLDLAPSIPGAKLLDKARYACSALGHHTAVVQSNPTDDTSPHWVARQLVEGHYEHLVRFGKMIVRKARAVDKDKLNVLTVEVDLAAAYRAAALAVAEALRIAPPQAPEPEKPAARADEPPREFVSGESLHPLLGRLERWLAEHRPAFLAELAPGASPAQLEAIERKVGVTLSPLHSALLRWRNGGSLDNLWGHFFLLSSEDVLEAIDIDPEEFDEPLWWHEKWFPFLDTGNSNYLCVDYAGCFGGQPGQLVEFWHEDEERGVRYPNIEAWLSTFVEGLELGLFDDDGTELDDELFKRFERSRNPGYPLLTDANWKPGTVVEVEEVEPISREELEARIAELRAPEIDVAPVLGEPAAPLEDAPAPSAGELAALPIGTFYFYRGLPYRSYWVGIYVKLADDLWAKGKEQVAASDQEFPVDGALRDLRQRVAEMRQREYRMRDSDVASALSDASIYRDGIYALEGRPAREDPYFCRKRSRLNRR